MHLKLEDINLLLERKCSERERQEYVEHILDCVQCRHDFKMLHELKAEMAPVMVTEKRHVLRYAIGVAAVLFLSAWPYFQSPSEQALPSELETAQKVDRAPLNLLSEIQKVNHGEQMAQWGKTNNIQDLIKDS